MAQRNPEEQNWAGELGDGENQELERGLTVEEFLEQYPTGVFRPALNELAEQEEGSES